MIFIYPDYPLTRQVKVKEGVFLKDKCCFVTQASKAIEVVVSSFRIDRILATGLGIGRRQSEYSLLGGLVKLNGLTVTKKSIEVKEGDTVDCISPEESTENSYNLNRVHLREVHQATKKGKFRITLLRTNHLNIEKEEYKTSFKLK